MGCETPSGAPHQHGSHHAVASWCFQGCRWRKPEASSQQTRPCKFAACTSLQSKGSKFPGGRSPTLAVFNTAMSGDEAAVHCMAGRHRWHNRCDAERFLQRREIEVSQAMRRAPQSQTKRIKNCSQNFGDWSLRNSPRGAPQSQIKNIKNCSQTFGDWSLSSSSRRAPHPPICRKQIFGFSIFGFGA